MAVIVLSFGGDEDGIEVNSSYLFIPEQTTENDFEKDVPHHQVLRIYHYTLILDCLRL